MESQRTVLLALSRILSDYAAEWELTPLPVLGNDNTLKAVASVVLGRLN